jgi:hypothetical protein
MSDDSKLTNTSVSNRRRSQRVFLKIRVVARFRLLEREWIVDGDTIVVNAHGGTVYLPVAPMFPGDIITLTNPATDQSETCRVLRIDSMPARPFDPAPTNNSATNSATMPRSATAPGSKSIHSASTRNSIPMPTDHGFEVAFAFDRPCPHFWSVAFPPTDWIESLVEH